MRSALSLLLLAALAAVPALPAAAQTQTILFPGQSGATLLASIRAQYRPTSYGTNDDLYSIVDRTTVGGQSGVVCVYTGLFVPFDGQGPNGPTTDPSVDVGNGFSPTGNTINQEHTFPQSRLNGPGGSPAESDLHNLFPSQVGVNSDRGSFPFAEIPDAQTTRWYRGGPPYNQTAIPSANIDEHSELRSGTSFEPREDHKGNVARAMFYMDAVYADADHVWFMGQLADLYRWNREDAISQADQDRSGRVAVYQNGKNNPFVLDSTLARRAYFPNVVADDAGPDPSRARLEVVGANPFRTEARLTLRLPVASAVRAEAFDALGRRVAVLFDGAATTAPLELRLDGAGLPAGVYAVRVIAGEAVLTQRVVHAR